MASKKMSEEDNRDVFEKALDDESAEKKRRQAYENSKSRRVLQDAEAREGLDIVARTLAGAGVGYLAPAALRKLSKRYKKWTETNPERVTRGERFHEFAQGLGSLGGAIAGYSTADRPVARGRAKRKEYEPIVLDEEFMDRPRKK